MGIKNTVLEMISLVEIFSLENIFPPKNGCLHGNFTTKCGFIKGIDFMHRPLRKSILSKVDSVILGFFGNNVYHNHCMVAVLKPNATAEQINSLTAWLQGRGLTVHITKGELYTIIGLIGDTSQIDIELLESLEMVDSVKRISEPFKSANRKYHPDDSIIEIGGDSQGGGLKIGGPHFQIMAGPCSVESPQQILDIARSVCAIFRSFDN